MPEILGKSDRASAPAKLKSWREAEGSKAIAKTFALDDFNAAFG
jgi:hypothetical protein